MAEKDIIINLQVNTGDSNQKVEQLAKSEKELAVNTTDANQAIKQNTQVTSANANAVNDTVEANISLKKQLRGLQEELARLAIAGKQNTAEYKKLKNEAGQLKDAISDVSAEISQAGSDTRGLDQTIRVASVAAASFSILEGTAALFGKENEELQKSLLKVTAAMSILNGLQEIQAELTRKDSLFTKGAAAAKLIYAAAVGTSTGAMKLFRLALLATGIGAFIVALGLLIANFEKVKSVIEKAFPGLAAFGNKVKELVLTITDFIGITSEQGRATDKLVKSLENETKELERQKALQDARGNRVKSYELEQKILKNQVRILQLQGAEEQEILDAKNAILVSEAQYQKSLEQTSKKTKEKQGQEAETLGFIESLKEDLKQINEQISNLGSDVSVDLVTKLFGDKARLEDSIKGLEEAFDLYRLIAETDLINPSATEDIATLESNIGTINTALNKLETDAGQRQELVLKLVKLNEQLEAAKINLQLLKDAALVGPVVPDFYKKAAEDAIKAKEASDDYFANEATNRLEYFEGLKKQKQDEQKLRDQRIQDAAKIGNEIFNIAKQSQIAQQQLLDNRLKQGLITEEQYAEKVKELRRKEAIAAKLQAVFNASINLASAISAALGKTGNPIVAGIVAAIAAAQLAAIIATPIPKFFKGVIDLKRGANPVGRDTIPAMLNEGESVMTTAETKRYKDVFTHIRNNTFESTYLPKMAYKILNVPNTKALSGIKLTGNGNRSDKAIEEELRMLRLMLREGNRINKRTADNTGELKKPRRRAFNV